MRLRLSANVVARKSNPPPRLRGLVRLPGDKSISHRAALLNALAGGEAIVDNFLPGADCLSTLACVRSLGVESSLNRTRTRLAIRGAGLQLNEPCDVLDAGNSGTTTRLLAGILAGQPFFSVVTGDGSLRSRPMARVVEPLRGMGARIDGREEGRLAPLSIRGGNLSAIEHVSKAASAQVKSAILLAGLFADGTTSVTEPSRSRDHTERMLAAMGAPVAVDGLTVSVSRASAPLQPLSLRVPGDISAAAFWLVAGSIHPDADLTIENAGLNPTRTGVLDILLDMGADITVSNEHDEGGEPVGDLRVRSSRLRGTEIGGDLVPRSIDELPVIALAAALAEGRTIVRDAAELRVKETDRVATVARELGVLGAKIEPRADGFEISGVKALTGGSVASHGDHRLAMLLGVAGLVTSGVVVEGSEDVAVSYPRFWQDLDRLSAG